MNPPYPPNAPQFVVVPRTGIQMCRRVALEHLDALVPEDKVSVWKAACDASAACLSSAKNVRLPLVANYACCDLKLESSGWIAADDVTPAYFRLLKIGEKYYADVLIDTRADGVLQPGNRIPCRVTYGWLRNRFEVCSIYVEKFDQPQNRRGVLVVDYGNTGSAAMFCPDPDGAHAAQTRAMALPTVFDDPATPAGQILKSTMLLLWAPPNDAVAPWAVYGKQAENLIGITDPLVTSLYAPKKYVRKWSETFQANEPATRYRGVVGQRDGLYPKQKFVEHAVNQLLENVVASLVNPECRSIAPQFYPQVRTLLLTYPLTWREPDLRLFKAMFKSAAERLFQQEEDVRGRFSVDLVCSEPVAVATYVLHTHLSRYLHYGSRGLVGPTLASSTLGNLKGDQRLRVLVVDIGGGSTDITLLDVDWEVVESENGGDHVEVSFKQVEWAKFNRAGDRISHLLATAIYRYAQERYGIRESLDFEAHSANPDFNLNLKRNAVSEIMRWSEAAKVHMVSTGKPWKPTEEDMMLLQQALCPQGDVELAAASDDAFGGLELPDLDDGELGLGGGFGGGVSSASQEPKPVPNAAAQQQPIGSLQFSLQVLKEWVEADRRCKETGGEPGFMDIFVYLSDMAAQCRAQDQEINLVILSGRTSRLPFVREFARDALGVPWHRVRTVSELIPEGLRPSDHADADKLAVVYGGYLFRNGGQIRFSLNSSFQAGQFRRHVGVVVERAGGMRLGNILAKAGESAPRTVTLRVPANREVFIGQAFRADGEVEVLGVLRSSVQEDRDVEVDIFANFQVELKNNAKAQGVTYTEWVTGGTSDIVDNFNDTGRVDCEPDGFLGKIVMSNRDKWIVE